MNLIGFPVNFFFPITLAKTARQWAGLLLLSLLAGCSQIEQLLHSDNPLVYIEGLVSSQRFEQALQFMENLPDEQRNTEVLEQRYKKLRLQAMAYEKTQVDEAQKLAAKKDWVASLSLLNEALDNYERGALLQQSHQAISAKQQRDLRRLWLDFNHERAKAMPDLLTQIERITAAGDNSDEAEEILRFYREQSTLLADFFALQADLQVSQRAWRNALYYFELADRLSAEPRYQKEISRIKRRLVSQPVDTRTLDELLARFEGQMDRGELLAAQTSLEAVDELHKGADIKQQRAALQRRIDERVQSLVETGREHYAKGQLNAAISLWRQGLILEPEQEELIDLLTRAEAFKAHYEKLREAN